jgi:hypothetical protein
MYTRAIRTAKFFFVGLVVVLLGYSTVSAEVRSGIWQWTQGGDTARVDFSFLTSFCPGYSSSKCSVEVADCCFRFDSIIASNGIYYDSSISANLQAQFIKGKTLGIDREALFYLDSMMKKNAFKAPQEATYKKSISSRCKAFFIKTSETRHAVMIQAGEYIGGIDRTWYYWAYQTDSTLSLSKNAIFEQPDSLRIAMDIFSGRPNPVFTMKDSAAIASITHQLYVSINVFLDSTLKRNDTTACSSGLGYRELSISGMFESESPMASYSPYLDICQGKLHYHKMATTPLAPYLFDKDSRLEKLIIRFGCEKNLSATDSYGTVNFCDIVPDSLKPSTDADVAPTVGASKNPVFLFRVGVSKICYRIETPGIIRIDVLDVKGHYIATLTNRRQEKGDYAIDMRSFRFTTGAYILKYSSPDTKAANAVVPVVLFR